MARGSRVIGMGVTGLELTDLERTILHETPPAAVILFARNVESDAQLRVLVASIHAAASQPVVVAIDEEGGRVDRLRALVAGVPAAAAFVQAPAARSLAADFGRLTGSLLRHFGIDVNLAPVVDLGLDPPAQGLERRCFGSDPREVTELARQFINGQGMVGVGSCLKHFPGLGRAHDDTHYGGTVIDAPRALLERDDLLPFRELAPLAGAVMVSHAAYPSFDPEGRPATLSPPVVGTLLRDEIGFTGVVLSDDMEMHAVWNLGRPDEILEQALLAGCDVISFCSRVELIPELAAALDARASVSDEVRSRLEEAVGRVEAWQSHCSTLRAAAGPNGGGLEAIRRDAESLNARLGTSVGEPSSGGGTGETGREEWT